MNGTNRAHILPSHGELIHSEAISAIVRNIESSMHGWPAVITTAVLVIAAIAVAAILQIMIVRMVPKRLLGTRPVLGRMIKRMRKVLFFFIAVLLLGGVVPVVPISESARINLLHVLGAVFIVMVGWTFTIMVDATTAHQLAHRPENIQSDAIARKHVTQWQVLRRVSYVLTFIVTVAAALMMFPAVRAYGVSLLASAGAAGLVVGLAARPVLSNLIAGVQIAITQPLRVEDAVVINGQWGWVEEITSTYVVVRIWNWQRMIVPLAWLLGQPFQNWTRDSSELIGTVHWNVDYTVPVDVLRKKLDEIVHSTPLWSGKVMVLQVTQALATTIELRALVSARNSGEAWDLRCYVREKMIGFLQAEYPNALPKQRLEIDAVTMAQAEVVGAQTPEDAV